MRAIPPETEPPPPTPLGVVELLCAKLLRPLPGSLDGVGLRSRGIRALRAHQPLATSCDPAGVVYMSTHALRQGSSINREVQAELIQ